MVYTTQDLADCHKEQDEEKKKAKYDQEVKKKIKEAKKKMKAAKKQVCLAGRGAEVGERRRGRPSTSSRTATPIQVDERGYQVVVAEREYPCLGCTDPLKQSGALHWACVKCSRPVLCQDCKGKVDLAYQMARHVCHGEDKVEA